MPAKPGQTVNLKATLASSPAEAAKVYPANYWYSLLEVPAAERVSRARASTSTASPPTFQTQAQFVDQLKQGCQLCHQLGNELTRGVGHMKSLNFKTSLEAWDHRVKTGQRGSEMDSMMRRLGPRALKMYADWTDKIAAGALPPAPPRPTGVERNAVITHVGLGQLDLVHARRDHDLEAESARERERAGLGGRRRARQRG